MFADLLQSVEKQYAKQLPFVIYRKPNELVVRAVLQADDQLHQVKDFSETGFVFAPFDENKASVLLMADAVMEANYNPTANLETNMLFKNEANAEQQEFHLNIVTKGIAKIKTGALEKVVLSHTVDVVCKASPLMLFQKLLNQYDTAFCYLWYHPKVGTWLGATPEILLKTENRVFTTMSLAGTQNFVEGVIPDWGRKEIGEQQLVTDYISEALKYSVSNLKIGARESIQAGSLWHLRTKLSGSFEKENFSKIIKALHPTPAVCGLPREAAKQFILANENYDRAFYTGYLGELNFKIKKERSSNRRNQENKAYAAIKTTTTLFVNLRCMEVKNEKAKIFVGGGVTADSIAEKEWDETVAKCATMLRIIS